jgi:hypothetical protein
MAKESKQVLEKHWVATTGRNEKVGVKIAVK